MTDVSGADRPSSHNELSPAAWARIAITFAIMVVLITCGWKGWSSPVWFDGAALLIGLVIIGKGYWRPAVWRQIIAVAGLGGALGVVLLIPAFNLLLSAAFIGAGVLIGQPWRLLL